MRVKACVGGFPRSIRREKLRHVRLSATRLTGVKQLGGPPAHQVGRGDVRVCKRDRKLDPLIDADWATKNDPVLGVVHRLLNEPAPVANTLRRDQDPLRVQTVEQLVKAVALAANHLICVDDQVIDMQMCCVVIDHGLDWLHHDAPGCDCIAKIDEKNRQAFSLYRTLVTRRRSRE